MVTDDLDHNPHLRPWRRPRPEGSAGKGHVENVAEMANIPWQTRAAPPTDYENALADAVVQAFESGAEELSDMVASLNNQGVHAPDGQPWTEESFALEMKRLGG
jgi:hypothetical protein